MKEKERERNDVREMEKTNVRKKRSITNVHVSKCTRVHVYV